MTEKINPETWFIIKIYTFEYFVKFSFWVSVYEDSSADLPKGKLSEQEHDNIFFWYANICRLNFRRNIYLHQERLT